MLAWAETEYDQVLIDSPPALATSDAAVIGRLVDGVVIVVQPEKNRRRLVMRAAEAFTSLKIPMLGVVVNRLDSDSDRGYYGYGYGYGYGSGYGTDETDGGSAAEGEDVTGVDPDLYEEADAPENIVPRRVA